MAGNLSLQLDQAIEVSDECREIAAKQTHPYAMRQVIKQREDTAESESKERGNDQVEGSSRDNTG